MLNPRALAISKILALALALCLPGMGCGTSPDTEGEIDWECQLDPEMVPDSAPAIGCAEDFALLASLPPSASIPGATSVKTVVDRSDEDALYFQNTLEYPIHYEFVSANLSGDGLPLVSSLGEFNLVEYYSEERRFILGALTYYAGPDVWCWEISPYDTASAALVETAFDRIRASTFMPDLHFHPPSAAVEAVADRLPRDIPIITTDELFEGIDYQALNLGTSVGRVTFYSTAELETSYVHFRDIVVLEDVPNDISVTAGIITEAFQTPLSHINVLSQNRGTPNMGLRGAFSNEQLRSLEGRWVRLEVDANAYSVTEVTEADADAWWEANRPEPLGVPTLDLSVTDLRDIEEVLDLETHDLGGALAAAIPAFGGKASHYGGIALIGEEVPTPKAFAIPVYYYREFMADNGFDDRIATLLADPTFIADAATRDAQLLELQAAIEATPLDPAFEALVIAKLRADYPGTRMRFRSSTNAEDLEGFTGAGLYTSKSGDPDDPTDPVSEAILRVWASVWSFRAFEEREYRGIDHTAVGMALLVHRSFPDEEANGVALTANIFDRLCAEPGFYINVQAGEESVVQPAAGVTTDQFVYHYDYPGQPIVWLSHSSLVGSGESVLTRTQTYDLGRGLSAIHAYFQDLYGGSHCDDFYAMDVEFKFDGEPGEEPQLFIKQARPHPGWGL